MIASSVDAVQNVFSDGGRGQ